ncbi:hypothetical protein AGDE_10881 [Angomonas deanei]|nr:hypothetical protein AGDE_10881 [Angomonas deanei]|eukprot:EPY27207.1 hypothetical protein AGDE_10881 [Angomonas deanei]
MLGALDLVSVTSCYNCHPSFSHHSICLAMMNEKPRLIEADEEHPANVILIGEFPWYVAEKTIASYLTKVVAKPHTTRLYDNPINGSSRGICFVEFDVEPSASEEGVEEGKKLEHFLQEAMKRIENSPYEEIHLECAAYHLTNKKWDRGGRLPDTPNDAVPLTRNQQQIGYGESGYAVRFGRALGLPNTVLEKNVSRMRALRKRLRTYSRSSSSSQEGE